MTDADIPTSPRFLLACLLGALDLALACVGRDRRLRRLRKAER